MQSKMYIAVTRNGKTKVYTTEKYMLLRRLKFIGAIVTAIAVMLLMCGMSLADGSPTVPLQIVALLGMGLLFLILLICAYVSDGEPQEKQEKRKGKKR